MTQAAPIRPVLILGAGINGCAVARELVLNGVPVTIVDTADIATGATAKSSRLIHGGVRYLEYGDFALVSESLAERERQLRLAPQFVKPLQLHIPVGRRFGGLIQSVVRFLNITRFSLGRWIAARVPASERGLLVIRCGLWMYDLIARSSRLPRHSVHRQGEPGVPKVDPSKYSWLCSYFDAQMLFPERFVIALLEDARRHAEENQIDFRVLPYHEAVFDGQHVRVHSLQPNGAADSPQGIPEFEPVAIVNATGAWGDLTLGELGVESERLFGGTKGSHILTRHPGLRDALGDGGVYAESSDGRLVFVLPFGETILIGTTDLRFEGSPAEVIASTEEVQYLVDMVNSVFSGLDLSIADVESHYCGVRPLPFVSSGRTGSIPRGHSLHTSDRAGVPLHTLIGGKLTTWRAFGEEIADRILDEIGTSRTLETRDRLVPGAEDFPDDVERWCRELAMRSGASEQTLQFLVELYGTECQRLVSLTEEPELPGLPELPISAAIVKEIIRREWVTRLEDLIERRFCLVLGHTVTDRTLEFLADCLIASGRLSETDRESEIARCEASLKSRYGFCVKNVKSS